MDHLVFLGDHIDREPTKWGSIYNITYLLLLKLLYHEKVILLKGNHECNYLIPCYPYEFEKEIIQRFGSSKLHSKYVEVFSSIPLITLTTYNNTLGFSIYNDRCLTIFSSQRYKNMGNGGILVAKVEKNVKYASDIVIEDFSTGEWNKYKIIKR